MQLKRDKLFAGQMLLILYENKTHGHSLDPYFGTLTLSNYDFLDLSINKLQKMLIFLKLNGVRAWSWYFQEIISDLFGFCVLSLAFSHKSIRYLIFALGLFNLPPLKRIKQSSRKSNIARKLCGMFPSHS